MNKISRKYNSVVIAAGSNLEDKLENCRKAFACLSSSGCMEVVSMSGFYLSEPVGYAEQPWFINSVLSVRTHLSPVELLRFLKKVENKMGRVDTGLRNGPRIIDLDIIFYNDLVLDSKELKLPHPRMQDRGFVLKPLCEIAPDWVHPVFNIAVSSLLTAKADCHEICFSVDELYN